MKFGATSSDRGGMVIFFRRVTQGVSNLIAPGAKTQNLFNAAGRKYKTWLNVSWHELEQAAKQHQNFDVFDDFWLGYFWLFFSYIIMFHSFPCKSTEEITNNKEKSSPDYKC